MIQDRWSLSIALSLLLAGNELVILRPPDGMDAPRPPASLGGNVRARLYGRRFGADSGGLPPAKLGLHPSVPRGQQSHCPTSLLVGVNWSSAVNDKVSLS